MELVVICVHLMTKCVRVEMIWSYVGSLGHEEDDKRQHEAGEDGAEVEGPLPVQRIRHLAHNDWCKECSSKQTEIRQCHSLSSFMHKVQIADTGID